MAEPVLPHTARHLARIVLIRHARSAHVQRGWITADGLRAWRAQYEQAGISASERMPAALVGLVTSDTVVCVSTARRTRETARLLAPTHATLPSPLLCELEFQPPPLGGVRLPLLLWAIVIGLDSWRNSRRGTYPTPAERTRVQEAATWLVALAVQHPRVVVVTHAAFRSQVAKELRRRGWRDARGWRSMRPWSVWSLDRGA